VYAGRIKDGKFFEKRRTWSHKKFEFKFAKSIKILTATRSFGG